MSEPTEPDALETLAEEAYEPIHKHLHIHSIRPPINKKGWVYKRILSALQAAVASKDAQIQRLTTAPVDDREFLGRFVRKVWTEWAREQSQPKASWLFPWELLPEPLREVDRRIGEKVAQVAAAVLNKRIEDLDAENATLHHQLAEANSQAGGQG